MKQFILLTTCLTALCLPCLAAVEVVESKSSVIGQCDKESYTVKGKHKTGMSRNERKAANVAAKAQIETECFKTCEALAKTGLKDSAREASACVSTCSEYQRERTSTGLHW